MTEHDIRQAVAEYEGTTKRRVEIVEVFRNEENEADVLIGLNQKGCYTEKKYKCWVELPVTAFGNRRPFAIPV